ncbi:MAG: stage III sporulation protein AA [Clostridia bacterium]
MEHQGNEKRNEPASIYRLFPDSIRRILINTDFHYPIEEIRLRIGKPIELVSGSFEKLLSYSPTYGDFNNIVASICDHSLYSHENDIKRGFITLPQGNRVGIAGRIVEENGKILRITDISSLSIRVSREIKGCGTRVLKRVLKDDGSIQNTLIISPPSGGKTTLLRDLARLISNGVGGVYKKVVIIDERSELSACVRGVPSFDVGLRTDVLDACKKSEGMLMAIRALSPDVLITDEIGSPDDFSAIKTAMNSGVSVIASAHGNTLHDFFLRTGSTTAVFEIAIILRRREGRSFFAVDSDNDMEFIPL